MKRGKLVQILATAVALVVFLAGVLTAVERSRTRDEPTPEPRALAPAPLAVTIAMLDVPGRIALGSSQPVRIEAAGSDIESVTLWEDDRALATFGRADGTRADAFVQSVDWTAIAPGAHVLHASARGAGGTAHSAPVALTVALSAGTPPTLEVAVPKGTTARAFADAHGIDPAVVRLGAASDKAGSDERTADDSVVTVDVEGVLSGSDPKIVPAAFSLQSAGSRAARDTSGTAVGVTPRPITSPGVVEHVGAPARDRGEARLAAHIDGCKVSVSSSMTAGKTVVYRLAKGSVGFTEVGELAAGHTLDPGTLTPGVHVFVAGPKGRPTMSTQASVTVPDSCVNAIWSGNASLIGGVITIPKPNAGLLAAYLGVDGKPAVRIPSDSLSQIRSPSRRIDVTPYLPNVSGSKLHLEVWSTDPLTNVAAKIASGDAEVPKGMVPADVIGESGQAFVTISPGVAKVRDQTISATWKTMSPRADRVVWQVTTQPIAVANTSLAPPGLVASGVSMSSGRAADTTGNTGTFTIPISSLVHERVQVTSTEPLTYLQIGKGSSVANLPTKVAPVITDKMAIDPSKMLADRVWDADVTSPLATPPPTQSSSVYYIRVVPLHELAPLGGASDAARFTGVTPTDPPQVALDPTDVTYSGGRAANPALTGCVRVTSLPWNGRDQTQFYSAFFATPGTYCAGDWGHDSCWLPKKLCKAWSAVVEAVEWVVNTVIKVWDVIAMIYNKVVDTVVNVLAKLNPYCVAAAVAAKSSGALGFSDKVTDVATNASDLCDKISYVATKAAVSAVMQSFGIPPELPTSEQLIAIAKGDLTELAVTYLKELGIPCDALVIDSDEAGAVSAGLSKTGVEVPEGVADGVDVCRDSLGLITDKIGSEIKDVVQRQLVASTGLPLPFQPIDGFEFELEPRGQYSPPLFEAAAKPTSPSTPFSGVCTATVGGDLGWKPEKSGAVWAFTPSTVQLTYFPFFGEWRGSTRLAFNPKAGITPVDQSLAAGTKVRLVTRSDCLGDAPELVWVGTVDPPLGRWKPGDKD